ncbi:MAG TPA: YeeE/YedE family protein [Oceanospirillaceae bacterium]|nr:YeeE/YedE family protein [Oceanospirillaceae bacterium]
MDYEQLISDIGIQPLQLYLGLVLGLTFGVGATLSHFCLRKLVIDVSQFNMGPSSYTWLLGLGVSLLATQLLLQGDASDISEAQIIAADASLSGPIIGGLMFGFGMVLSRGCSSRQFVLIASGNLRSLFTFITFALTAQLAYGGQLTSLRNQAQDLWRLDWPTSQLYDVLPLAQSHYAIVGLVIVGLSAAPLIKQRAWPQLTGALLVGLAIAAGWHSTSFVAYHSFGAMLPQSITFSAPAAQNLITIFSLDAPFVRLGAGLLVGCFVGSALISLLRRDFKLQGFDTQHPMSRYLVAGTLMGLGSVIASGCSVGAGLSGISVLAVNAIVTLACIIIGGLLALRYKG